MFYFTIHAQSYWIILSTRFSDVTYCLWYTCFIPTLLAAASSSSVLSGNTLADMWYLIWQKLEWLTGCIFSLEFANRSGRGAHTFPLMKSMQKSRQNNASARVASAWPAILSGQPAWAWKRTKRGFLLNIMLMCTGIPHTVKSKVPVALREITRVKWIKAYLAIAQPNAP